MARHLEQILIIMRYILLISMLFVSIINSFRQNPYFDFDYEKSNYTAVVVQSRDFDSLTHRDKTVLEGVDFKVPFYHFVNERNSDNSYVILLHGLTGNKDYWVNPSLPYLQIPRTLQLSRIPF